MHFHYGPKGPIYKAPGRRSLLTSCANIASVPILPSNDATSVPLGFRV